MCYGRLIYLGFSLVLITTQQATALEILTASNSARGDLKIPLQEMMMGVNFTSPFNLFFMCFFVYFIFNISNQNTLPLGFCAGLP